MKNKNQELYILSIQRNELVTVNGYSNGQDSLKSYIKVLDAETGEKLDWKLGVFTQSKHYTFEDEELEELDKLGFKRVYVDPWDSSKNDKDINTGEKL
jgi:hypothetical protein